MEEELAFCLDYDSRLTTDIAKLKFHEERVSQRCLNGCESFRVARRAEKASNCLTELPKIRLLNFDG